MTPKALHEIAVAAQPERATKDINSAKVQVNRVRLAATKAARAGLFEMEYRKPLNEIAVKALRKEGFKVVGLSAGVADLCLIGW